MGKVLLKRVGMCFFLGFLLSFGETISVEWKGEDGKLRKYEVRTDEGFKGTLSGLWVGENKVLRGSKIIFEEKEVWKGDADDTGEKSEFKNEETFFSEKVKSLMTESVVKWEGREVKVKHLFYTFDGDDGLYCRIVLEPTEAFNLIRAYKVDYFTHLEAGSVIKSQYRDDYAQGWVEWTVFGAPFSLSEVFLGVPGWYYSPYWKCWSDWDVDANYKLIGNNVLYSGNKFSFAGPIRADFVFFPSGKDDPSTPEPKGKRYYENIVVSSKEGVTVTGEKIGIYPRRGHFNIVSTHLPCQFTVKYTGERSKVILFFIQGLSAPPRSIYSVEGDKKILLYTDKVIDIWKDDQGYNTAFFLKLGKDSTIVISDNVETSQSDSLKSPSTIEEKVKYYITCGSALDKDWTPGSEFGCVRGKVYLGWANIAPGWYDDEKVVREDSEKIIYRFTSLDPIQKYRIKLGFYNEENSKKIRIVGDKVILGEVDLPVGKKVFFEKELPQSITSDRELELSVEAVEGNKAVVSQIWIIEGGKNEK